MRRGQPRGGGREGSVRLAAAHRRGGADHPRVGAGAQPARPFGGFALVAGHQPVHAHAPGGVGLGANRELVELVRQQLLAQGAPRLGPRAAEALPRPRVETGAGLRLGLQRGLEGGEIRLDALLVGREAEAPGLARGELLAQQAARDFARLLRIDQRGARDEGARIERRVADADLAERSRRQRRRRRRRLAGRCRERREGGGAGGARCQGGQRNETARRTATPWQRPHLSRRVCAPWAPASMDSITPVPPQVGQASNSTVVTWKSPVNSA